MSEKPLTADRRMHLLLKAKKQLTADGRRWTQTFKDKNFLTVPPSRKASVFAKATP